MTSSKRRRHTPEQIIRKLAEGHKQLAAGKDLDEVCRHLEIAESTWHRWLAQYGGMKANDAKRLKELEVENARLKKLLAEAELDNSRARSDCPVCALSGKRSGRVLEAPSLRLVMPVREPDDAAVRAIVLDGLAAGDDITDIARLLRDFHGDRSTYPATVLMELAADAYLACGSTRASRLELDGLAERMLPEDPARGNTWHSKRRHCVHGVILIAAGAEPEDTGWWHLDDLWRHALDAVVVFVRAAADRQGVSVETVCRSLTDP